MNLASVVEEIERPWRGNLNGVRVLVCGAADVGRLSIRLARHSAIVVQLTSNKAIYNAMLQVAPQALNLRIFRTNIAEWIEDCNTTFDIVVVFEDYWNLSIPNSIGRNIKKLCYISTDNYYNEL